MNSLDIVVHNTGEISIKDIYHGIDISEFKWDILINSLIDKTECVFFSGFRLNYTEEPGKIIGYVAEEVLYNENNSFEKILIRVNQINLINRSLLSKLWKAYDEPALIFLIDKGNERNLIDCMSYYHFGVEIFSRIPGIYDLYQGYEPDVLWIRSKQEIDSVLSAIEE